LCFCLISEKNNSKILFKPNSDLALIENKSFYKIKKIKINVFLLDIKRKNKVVNKAKFIDLLTPECTSECKKE